MNAPARRLYRSRTDKRIAGVCGGLARHFGIDPVIPRIILVALILGAGFGLLAYVIFWIVIPMEPAA